KELTQHLLAAVPPSLPGREGTAPPTAPPIPRTAIVERPADPDRPAAAKGMPRIAPRPAGLEDVESVDLAAGATWDGETLALLINDALLEQARRHGVDLS